MIHEGCQGDLAERLIYDGSHLIAVADRDGAVVTQFLHGPMVDQVLAESHFDSLSGDRTDVSFIASDHLGSVRGLLSWSDSTSSVVSQSWLSYDAYGNELSTSTTDLGTVGHTVTSEVRSRFGYTGRDRDSESDLQYNRARYYDAATGRWISKDPIGFAAGDANLYRYVGNQATTLTDPSGLKKFKVGGEVFFVHPNDVDPFPSDPHAHIGGANSPRKVHIDTGQIFQGAKPTDCNIGKKTLRELRRQMRAAGLLGLAVTVVLVVPEVAGAAEEGGLPGAVGEIGNIGVDSAVGAATSTAAGGVIIGGAGLAGTTVTIGGSAAAGLSGAAAVGGAVTAAGATGVGVGYGIGSINVCGSSIHEHLGYGMAWIYVGITE